MLAITALSAFAQTPQIALVKPNGTTTIHTTLQSAHDAAEDDDYIYLPGGMHGTLFINKRLHIIGAGSNEDSTQVTGISMLQFIIVYQGAQGGSIEGIKFVGGSCGSVVFEGNGGSSMPSNYTISNCYIVQGIRVHQNVVWSNLNIYNCFLGTQPCGSVGYCSLTGSISNSFLSNNIIVDHICCSDGLDVSNNVFFKYGTLNLSGGNSIYKNNIFLSNDPINSGNNVFQNNANCDPAQNQNNQNYNNVVETFDQIFVSPGTSPYTYDVHNDYHVKSTSACHNSGTDGTDRGIYGGAFPWKPGSIPSNPHIYHKNVAGSTNTNGQLQVQFKVRTGN